MPSSNDKPFSASAVWNKGISTSATYTTDTNIAQPVVGLSSWLPNDSSSVPMYDTTSTTPTENIRYLDTWWNVSQGTWKQYGNTAAVEAQILAASSEDFPFPYHPYVSQSGTSFVPPATGTYDPITNPATGARTAKIPAGAHPTANPDGHMAVWQPDGKVLETFGTIVLSDGTIVASSYKITDPALGGTGSQNGITASMIPVYAGVVRNEEIADGVIDHALKLVVPAGLLTTSYTGPALSFDRGALTESPAYSGNLPMGSHLAIPQSVDLSTLGLTTSFGMTVANAMQDYGAIITDRGGSGITIMTETGMTDSTWDNYSNGASADLDKIFNAARKVATNPDTTPPPPTGDTPTFTTANFTGTSANETIIGNDLDNIIDGQAGNDTIKGGAGADKIIGSYGSDVMTGNAGNDKFDWNLMSQFGPQSAPDVITDFTQGQDKIDLYDLDANSVLTGNQGFTFVGGNWLTNPGDLGFYHDVKPGTTSVQGDLNGDLVPDFYIELTGVYTLTANDFVL